MTRNVWQSDDDELYIISVMQEEAGDELTEAIQSFGNHRAAGLNVDRACAEALNEVTK